MGERVGASSKELSVHATAVALGETGILIRGPSGAGKSSLALALLDPPGGIGSGGRLVGDDRLSLSIRHGRLIARPHARIAGLVERRGEGLLPVPYEPAAVMRCVVDLIPSESRDILPRLPDIHDRTAQIAGVALPRLALPQSLPLAEAVQRVRAFVHRLGP